MISKNIDQFLLKSRESRLALQDEQKQRNPIQQFFGWGPIGWLGRTIIQSIPFIFYGYGLGDLVTGISGIKGRDILDGEKLDNVDKVLYFIATLIPFVPATILVSPMRLLRKYLEDTYYAYKIGNPNEATHHAQKLITTAKELRASFTKKKY